MNEVLALARLKSGGLAADILRRCQARGVRFSVLVTLRNCADLGPSDLLEFPLADPATTVIGMYLEGLSDAAASSRCCAGRAPPSRW